MQPLPPVKGPGRPKETPLGFKRVMISLPMEMVDDFKSLGGSRWVQEQIHKAIAKEKKEVGKITPTIVEIQSRIDTM